jgi:hypothetical protein
VLGRHVFVGELQRDSYLLCERGLLRQGNRDRYVPPNHALEGHELANHHQQEHHHAICK